MINYASTIIIGHLGRDPVTRTNADGTVTTLSVAVTRRAGADRAKDVTSWWKVSVWGKGADSAAKHLHKGDAVLCQGWPELETYQDGDGTPRTELRLSKATWSFAGGGKASGDQPSEHASAPVRPPSAPVNAGSALLEDPPF